MDAEFDPARGSVTLALTSAAGEHLSLRFDPDGGLSARFVDLDIARVGPWLPALAAYAPAGRVTGHLSGRDVDAGQAQLDFELQIRGVSFAEPGGLNAGEGLGLEVNGGVVAEGGQWRWHLKAAWSQGEAYLHPWYLTPPLTVRLSGVVDDERIRIDSGGLDLEGVRALEFRAELQREPMALTSAALALADADLAVVGPRYLLPAIAPALAARLELGGRVSLGGRFEDGQVLAVDLALAQTALALDGGRLAIGPVSGMLPWRLLESGVARLRIDGLAWAALALAPFEVQAHVHGNAVDFDDLTVPLLDGRVDINGLSLERREQGWFGQGGAQVHPVSMEDLTQALGLPMMSGQLSALVPGVLIRPGSVALDGALAINVFGGDVRVSRLELREPLGVAAYLTADVEARRLDLGKITDTFAFGDVSGLIDVDVLALELVRWRPVAFDAAVRSSRGRYPRRISQRAVQNIGALGGGGAAAVLQRGVLGFFESFGYRQLGLSCRLAEEVCTMGGIGSESLRADGGFVIVRGGGVPSLNVIGYNRRVDWPELLARLQGAIESNMAPVIE